LTNNPFAYRWVRRLDFEPGKLNIVTGTSARGKSALLDIVEYCIARSRVTLPIGPISQTVAWYAVVLQLPSVQAFVARPAPRQGAASSSQAMLRLGKRVSIPSSSELAVDIDDDSVRLQLGSLIGIEEIVRPPPASTLLNPIPINIKHALLLCFQGQSEIGSRTFLFHRQGEQGIAPAIRSTLPYFLGATPADYALKHQQLTSLKRDLRRVEGELREANSINEEIDFDVRSLLTEAYARGLVDSTSQEGRDDAIAALRRALDVVVEDSDGLTDEGERARELLARRAELRDRLRDLLEQRAFITNQERTEGQYLGAATTGAVRLRSIELIPDHVASNPAICPVCASTLAEPDPTLADLQASLNELTAQLREAESARPRKLATLAELDGNIEALRTELRAIDEALQALREADTAAAERRQRSQAQAFTQGRIHQYLSRIEQIAEARLNRLRESRLGLTSPEFSEAERGGIRGALIKSWTGELAPRRYSCCPSAPQSARSSGNLSGIDQPRWVSRSLRNRSKQDRTRSPNTAADTTAAL
jgi:hypothetical protein